MEDQTPQQNPSPSNVFGLSTGPRVWLAGMMLAAIGALLAAVALGGGATSKPGPGVAGVTAVAAPEAERRSRAATTAAPATTIVTLPSTTTARTPVDPEMAAAALDRRCEGWDLTFSDGFSGDWVDEREWTVYHSAGHDGNGLRRPSAFSVADGLLTITATPVDGRVVTGGMATLHTQTYGRFEARVRTDEDPSFVTSGVIITWPADNDWPNGGENNIYETGPNGDRWPFSSYVHFPDGTPRGGHRQIIHNADGARWHEVAMEWSPTEISMWRDGQFVGSVTDPDIIPDVAHRLTVQLDAMNPNPIHHPIQMEVDWVRVYKRASLGGPNQSITPIECEQAASRKAES